MNRFYEFLLFFLLLCIHFSAHARYKKHSSANGHLYNFYGACKIGVDEVARACGRLTSVLVNLTTVEEDCPDQEKLCPDSCPPRAPVPGPHLNTSNIEQGILKQFIAKIAKEAVMPPTESAVLSKPFDGSFDSKQEQEDIVTVLRLLIISILINEVYHISTKKPAFLFSFQGIPFRQMPYVYPFSLNQFVKQKVEEEKKDDELMNYEWSRYLSFKRFPVNATMTPMRLVQAGFFYTGRDEQVTCFCCRVTNGKWNDRESALQIHVRLSPDCDFISGKPTNNIPIHCQEYYADWLEEIGSLRMDGATGGPSDGASRGHDDVISTQVTSNEEQARLENLSATANREGNDPSASNTVRRRIAKHPKYTDEVTRRESFQNWTAHDIQSPPDLAAAGYFYVGLRDFVRCFYCGVGLKNWQVGDDPWFEHERWSKDCEYLKENRPTRAPEEQQQQQNQQQQLQSKNQQHRQERPQASPTAASNGQHPKVKLDPNRNGLNRACAQEASVLHQENQLLRQQMMCKVCRHDDANTVFLPCGHMTTCQACAVKQKYCNECKQQIKGTIRVYQS